MMVVNKIRKNSSSFRDPGGFVFTKDNQIYRAINKPSLADYSLLMSSGLYESLVKKEFLIAHKEIEKFEELDSDVIHVIQPDKVETISLPYEWCFSQLKDAALLTLEISKIALSHNMILKDASAYNVQFLGSKPIFIDTLSFIEYKEGMAWDGYQQFCKHFLSPLALMSKVDHRLSIYSRNFIDGIPLDVAAKLLPMSAFLSFGLFAHVYLHAKSQIKNADLNIKIRNDKRISRNGMLGIFDSLENTVNKLKNNNVSTEWGDYYQNTNYSSEAKNDKEKIVFEYLTELKPDIVWDLGANEGVFSRLADKAGANVVSWDIDAIAVEKNYLALKKDGGKKVTPLIQDITNPSPGIGWGNCERQSLTERGPVDTIMALALIHHLAISNNIPFDNIAKYFSSICENLILEFVPKSDSQVKKLLLNREDVFPNYNEEYLEFIFKRYFVINKKKNVSDSDRTLYLMKSNSVC